MSQSIFAGLIGVSVKTVQAWEQGKNRPQPVASRFMEEIQRVCVPFDATTGKTGKMENKKTLCVFVS